jgi:tRNA(Arg) A34 adenosine deaminase TadA
MISDINYEKFMENAIDEAKMSLKEGNKGFGAVIVKDKVLIACAHDSEITANDSTAHAEINVIRKASSICGKDLSGCILISTHEPCPMCSGAIIWSKISKLVYSVSIKDSLKLGRNVVDFSCKKLFKKSNSKIDVKSGVLQKECLNLYHNDVRNLVDSFRKKERSEWNKIKENLVNKRLLWFRNYTSSISKMKGTDVEKAYKLILQKIGINPKDAPIIEKSENKIVFHSKNFCPTLEACKILNLDTREVCKVIYEMPTDKLIKKINPKLKFARNYNRIRPYTNYCEEIITLEQ